MKRGETKGPNQAFGEKGCFAASEGARKTKLGGISEALLEPFTKGRLLIHYNIQSEGGKSNHP